MKAYSRALGGIPGGRALDVASGEGEFIETLATHLESYAVIVGIDTSEYTRAAGSVFLAEKVHFVQMDAGRLGFEDESFDTVSISSSLHHLEDIGQCLGEMQRVLKPGGHLVVRETHRDIQADAQLTDMYLHHWVAEVDTALGFTHNRTFSRSELVGFAEGLGLANLVIHEVANTDLDPWDEAAIQGSEEVIERYIGHARRLPGGRALEQRGEQIRRRLHRVGIQWEPEMLIIGQK